MTITAAVSPHISMSPATGVLGLTTFTQTGSGFTHNGTITQNVIYPNGGLTVYHTTADSTGAYSNSFVLTSQVGNYSETDTDDATGVKSNTINYSVTGDFSASVSPGSRTITAGQSTSYTVTFSSIGGLTGPISLQALNWQLSGMSGSWSPSSTVTLPSNGTVQATFTVNTSSSTPTGTISNIILQGTTGTLTRAAAPVSLTITAAVSPHISISPTSGTLGVTSFTESYSGFTRNSTVTENVTYPNGGLTIYHVNTDANGSANISFVLQSQAGNYSSYAVDDATGTHSNTITFSANSTVNPHISITPDLLPPNAAKIK